MKKIYIVNGWRESKEYFFSIGCFTDREKQMLEDGKTVEKFGDTFRIESIEE